MRLDAIAVITAALTLAATLAGAEPLTRSDRQGAVTVTVTLPAAPEAGAPLGVRVVLETHSVGLDGVQFDRAVVLRTADGDVGPTAVEVSGGGHHREAVLRFPPPRPGEEVRIVVSDVGGIAERVFAWPAVIR